MTFFGKALRAAAIVLAVSAGSMNAKPAQADGGAVIAGVGAALILGTIIGSTANANTAYHAPARTYHAPAQTYYAPAPRYVAPRYVAPVPIYAPAPVYVQRPYYGSSINISLGSKRHYRGGKRYRNRGYRAYPAFRGHHRRHHRRHYRGHH